MDIEDKIISICKILKVVDYSNTENIIEKIEDLTKQNKQMREALELMSNQCECNFQCIKNGKGCIAIPTEKIVINIMPNKHLKE